MTTLDNNLKNLFEYGPVLFKPGFEFLRKTEPDVNRFIATEFPEKMQQFLAIEKDHGHFEPDLAYAIKMYLYMAETLAGKPCIFNTLFDANDCVKAAKKMLDDYKVKEKTSKATIAARDEELAVCKEQLKAKDDQIKLKDELLACKDELLAAARQDCVLGTITTSGWVSRKVRQNEKWVRRWLEVNRHVLYSYQACPAESPQARVINMLDLRKISEIKLVDDGVAGLFSIVPVSADDQHPGYLMRADTAAKAQEWVSDLNKVRDQELAAAKAEPAVCDQLKTKDDQLKLNDEVLAELNDELLAELAVCKEQLKAKDIQLKLAVCEEKLQANEDLLKAKDENLKLSMELVALKDELAKAKRASKGQPLACVTNA